MPNCFQLLSRHTGKAETFHEIDRKLCEWFNVKCDDHKWYMDWYDIVGFQIACGKDLEKQIATGEEHLKAHPDDDHAVRFLAMLKYLHVNYTSDAWVEIGRK